MERITLKGDLCQLRALEPDDLDFLYVLENNPEIWEISSTITPYSRATLKLYLENAHRSIYEVGQFRLCICNLKGDPIGLIDLYDFEAKHKRAGLGIIILNPKERNRGIGSEAILLLLNYAFRVLELHQVYANILEDNLTSIRLFEKLGFELAGFKKDWIRWDSKYKNELLYQKIKL